jgi:inhibitor of KinA
MLTGTPAKVFHIPVCYEEEYGTDLASVAAQKQIPLSVVIDKHTSRTYKVYMIGFLPGFSYMGEVDEQIAVPRKYQPVPVIAGSVGIAGSQTGIYPLNCPGGWQIIGRTPVKPFDSNALQPVKLHAGDHVQFYAISREEFELKTF